MLMSQSNTSKLLLLISPRASATVPALFTLNPYCSMRGGSVRRILGSSSTNSSRLSSACWAETVGTAGFAILPRISFSRSSRTAFNSSIISRSFFGSCSLAARRASSRQSLCSLLGIMEYVRLKQLLHTLCSVQNKERQMEAATPIVEQISAKQNGSVPTASLEGTKLSIRIEWLRVTTYTLHWKGWCGENYPGGVLRRPLGGRQRSSSRPADFH